MKNANLVSRLAVFALLGTALLAGCSKAESGKSASIPPPSGPARAGDPAPLARYGYEVVRAWPHDPRAFTQGLVYRGGSFLESTGLNGRSSLREVQPETGRVLKQVGLASTYFGEGLAVVGAQAFWLTWQNGKCFVYDADTFQALKEFPYEGEGWGLATDGSQLILSDGTARIRFIDPITFAVKRTIDVTQEGKPRDRLNELEFIRGEIFANVWQTDEIVRIDPETGVVRGVVDFAGLLPPHERGPEVDVLNGIAYDQATDRLFVTGKCWPKLYEVRLKKL